MSSEPQIVPSFSSIYLTQMDSLTAGRRDIQSLEALWPYASLCTWREAYGVAIQRSEMLAGDDLHGGLCVAFLEGMLLGAALRENHETS